MKIFGWLLLLAGLLWMYIAYYGFSVEYDGTINIGLLANRFMVYLSAMGLFFTGLVVVVAASLVKAINAGHEKREPNS